MGLDTVELIMAFEERFGISIPDAEASELTTPRKVVDHIMGQVVGRGMTREQIVEIVRQVIEEQTSIHEFYDDDHFVHDMHLD